MPQLEVVPKPTEERVQSGHLKLILQAPRSLHGLVLGIITG